VVSSCPFFTPSGNREEDGKEEEADGDDHHVFEEINHVVAHHIAETKPCHTQQGDGQKKKAMGLPLQSGTDPFDYQFGTKKRKAMEVMMK